jgi:DNA-binding NtrC family response regulator
VPNQLPDSDETMPRRPGEPDGGSRALCLLVGADGQFATHPLPERGEVSIGREAGNQITIQHRSVSRRHALLRIGATVEIEDLGGANGVRVQGRSLPAKGRTAVSVGEVIELGEVLLILRPRAATAKPRRLWPHDYFEGRVEEQCERVKRSGEGFAVVRLGLTVPAPPGVVEDAFATLLRATDVLALYAPGEYEVLLVDTKPEEAKRIAERVQSHVERSGAVVRLGLAFHPQDGSDAEAIIARACDLVRGSSEGRPPTAMQNLHRLAQQVASSDLSVLILGETGAGKEVLAETVHRLSPRAKGPFVRLHCAALSETLLESELFGHEKGSFTGAHQTKAGLLETAEGGTVFLDEIGELPLSTQVKLLRVLEDRKVLRIGALTPRAIDVRFLAATNRDLGEEVARGRFRLDLYFRLDGMSLAIPPLRERPDEIEPLARGFIAQACERTGRRDLPALSPEALDRMRAYSWPGNVRELRNAIERAVLLCGAGPIGTEHLPTEKMRATLQAMMSQRREAPADAVNAFDVVETTTPAARPSDREALKDQLDALERKRILDALEQCAGNQTRAAKLLGISRNTLLARLDAYGIARPKKPSI